MSIDLDKTIVDTESNGIDYLTEVARHESADERRFPHPGVTHHPHPTHGLGLGSVQHCLSDVKLQRSLSNSLYETKLIEHF